MSCGDHKPDPVEFGPAQFATTDWSIVLASGAADTSASRAALDTLCRQYWTPLYAYARRHGLPPHDAEDMTQTFIARLLERHAFPQADQRRGRFRAFILTAFKNFLHDQWQKTRAQKRGGGQPFLSLDTAAVEYSLAAPASLSPDKLFDRRWALVLLEQSLARLECEYQRSGRGQLFAELQPFLTGDPGGSYAAVAGRLRMTEGAVKVAAHRLHHRYREVIRTEIARTVARPDEIEDELRLLRTALGA